MIFSVVCGFSRPGLHIWRPGANVRRHLRPINEQADADGWHHFECELDPCLAAEVGFKLYQRAYGMFQLDYDNFNKAVETITSNTEEYFQSKQDDEDIRVKRDKLRKYEGLIPFLENAGEVVAEYKDYSFDKFSKKLSEVISRENLPWEHISEELLVSKVAAEADLTTRLD